MKSYFLLIQCESLVVKIGKSEDPIRRAKQISAGIPYATKLIAVIDIPESELHKQFSEYRICGEWFRYTDAIRDFIRKDRCSIPIKKPSRSLKLSYYRRHIGGELWKKHKLNGHTLS